jgi:internalin A
MSKATLARMLKDGSALIMLDGLDEIGSTAVRKDLRDAVWDAMKRYPKCRWLFTSRIVGYDEVPFERRRKGKADKECSEQDVIERLASLSYVSPFNDNQIEQFAKNWYAQREADPYKAKEGAADLVHAVGRDRSVLQLARVPNLLTIMALIHRIKATLPNGKSLLYDDIAEAGLDTIDGYRKIKEDSDSLRDKKRWLGYIAFAMQKRRSERTHGEGILASDEDLSEWLVAAMSESGNILDPDEPRRFLDRVRRRSGLMIDRAAGMFAFTHLSFQEYFAAVNLKEAMADWMSGEQPPPDTGPSELRRYAGKVVWQEVLVFLFEQAAEERPVWKRRLWSAVFGEGDYPQIIKVDLEATSSDLLFRLALDPQVKWDEETMDKAILLCFKWHGKMQQANPAWYSSGAADVTRALIVGSASVVQKRLRILGDAYSHIGATKLNLCNMKNIDLASLTCNPVGLTKIQELYMRNSKVSNVAALEKIPDLKVLAVGGTEIPSHELTTLKSKLPRLSVVD